MKVPAPLLALASDLNIQQIHRVAPATEIATDSIETGTDVSTTSGIDIIRNSTDWLETATPEPRPDLVWVTSATLCANPAAAVQRLGRARNVISRRVVTELTAACVRPTDTDLLSLGFIRYAETLTEAGRSRWYLFDLMTYKPAPDWLNARFWANPDNWDKFRW